MFWGLARPPTSYGAYAGGDEKNAKCVPMQSVREQAHVYISKFTTSSVFRQSALRLLQVQTCICTAILAVGALK